MPQDLENKGRDVRTHNGGEKGKEPVIGFLGRLVPIKNPQMALKVFERLVRNRAVERPLRLVIAGDGELKSELEEQVRQARLEGQIEFAGWQQEGPKETCGGLLGNME